jgi:hypothetical protein
MKHPAKLEAAKGGMDALPIRIFLQVFPHACGHLYCAARQGALIFHISHTHNAESTTVLYTDLRANARDIPVRVSPTLETHLTRQLTRAACSRSPCRAARFCTS